MDKEVYTNDSVGNYFNDKFICVKVQMDKTKNDNEFIRNWYSDAAAINKQFRILGYPTFIFFSPKGIIVHKEMGYQSVSEVITLAQIATQQGKIYRDPFVEYDSLVEEYKQGIKHYNRMVYMIKIACQIGENDFAKQLLNDHTNYAAKIKPKQRYTKENIELWAGFTLSSLGKRFNFFYKDGNKIDRVMNKKGYARSVVDRTIQYEIVAPFFKEQANGAVMSTKWMTGNSKPDHSEVEWKKMYNLIQKKYNSSYAKRNLVEAKVQWYEKHNNFPSFVKYYLTKLELNNGEDPFLNSRAWDIFIKITDKKILNKIVPWMNKLAQQYSHDFNILDTYANLLYKIGKKQEAIQWEGKALNLAKTKGAHKTDIENFSKAIEQMTKGEPTYVSQGAIWPAK